MPRKSFAALAAPTPLPCAKPRIVAPERLTGAQSDVWRQVVNALPPGYFGSDVGLLLERFCVHFARARGIETLLAEVDPAQDFDRYERIAKAARAESAQAAALARALRITNQSRHPTTAGRMAAGAQPVRTAEDDAAAVAELTAWSRARDAK